VKKREEVQRMKALKTKELRAKLDRIGKEGGKNLDDEGRWLGFQLRNVL
jgi:protein KRI1